MSRLGFSNLKDSRAVADTLKKAAEMQPTPLSDEGPSTAEVARIVSEQPGVIPQVSPALVTKRKKKGITNPLNMRVRVATFNRFVRLSQEFGKPYDETLEELMELAEVDEMGHMTRRA